MVYIAYVASNVNISFGGGLCIFFAFSGFGHEHINISPFPLSLPGWDGPSLPLPTLVSLSSLFEA